jgi:TetR/AcrR family transcriptional regulator
MTDQSVFSTKLEVGMALKLVDMASNATETKTVKRDNKRPLQILNAAVELFRDRGFEATRLEDVADKAGVSKATIYLYFESKEDLFFALIREKVVPMVEQTIAQADAFEGPASEFLRMKAQGLGRIFAHSEQGAILKLVISEARRFPDLADYYRAEVPERGLENLSKMIRRGIDEGEFRECDTRAAAVAFMFPLLMTGIWMNSVGPDDIIRPDEATDFHCENFIRGLRV